MFGRNKKKFVTNPFLYVEDVIKEADVVIFNLETVVSTEHISDSYKEHKTFNFLSNGEPLLSLRDITNKPIFTAIANNHSLDYGLLGLLHTKHFLREQKIHYTVKNRAIHRNNVCFINATDHCSCNNPNTWAEHIWIIDYKNLKPIIQKIKNLSKRAKNNNEILIFSIHWGSNWLTHIPRKMKRFGRMLIDNGVDIVFGHSAHHIPPTPIEFYKQGLIIYGLGDFVNDYAIKHEYKSNNAMMCIVDTEHLTTNLIQVEREFVNQSSIPKVI